MLLSCKKSQISLIFLLFQKAEVCLGSLGFNFLSFRIFNLIIIIINKQQGHYQKDITFLCFVIRCGVDNCTYCHCELLIAAHYIRTVHLYVMTIINHGIEMLEGVLVYFITVFFFQDSLSNCFFIAITFSVVSVSPLFSVQNELFYACVYIIIGESH